MSVLSEAVSVSACQRVCLSACLLGVGDSASERRGGGRRERGWGQEEGAQAEDSTAGMGLKVGQWVVGVRGAGARACFRGSAAARCPLKSKALKRFP
eukprot:3293766-Rhodomonas_salina.1